ncbi:hypothetical protein CMV_028443 [Castanea mollissima]|uniref:Uncharacterized protein n=1 Tax=Castanea mollissima TaxID=60419 RepID=A0A8J4Q8G1_9ROSI|nr:hypothetical protein CMV_028443 [Castanea mollissima]
MIKPQRGVQRLYQTHKLNLRALSSFSPRSLSKQQHQKKKKKGVNCSSFYHFCYLHLGQQKLEMVKRR